MDGDSDLTKEQILEEAEAIRKNIEYTPHPAERKMMKDRYMELDRLLKSGDFSKTRKTTSQKNQQKAPKFKETIDSTSKNPIVEVADTEEIEYNKIKDFKERLEKEEGYEKWKKKELEKKKAKESLTGCSGCLVIVLVIAGISIFTNSTGNSNSNKSRTSSSGISTYINRDAVEVVAKALIGANKLGVTKSDLATIPNPKGEGTFIYVRKTTYNGVNRYLMWLEIDGRGYKLNGPSSMLTPSLNWPRDAPKDVWQRTGLDLYSATGSISIIFGK